MEINLTDHLRKHTRIGSIVLHNLTYILKDKIKPGEFGDQNRDKDGNTIVDLKLTMNDIELDLESYIERWDKSVDEYMDKKLTKRAIDFMDGKFIEVEDLLEDLKDRIKPEIENRLEDWEKEE